MDIIDRLFSEARKVPGGYVYSGACSYQVCFPLKNGGELRILQVDDDVTDSPGIHIDYYDGAVPPGVTGPVDFTGNS